MSNQGGYSNSRNAGTTAVIVMLLLLTIIALVLATFAWAKYTSQATSSATATVAKWNVSFTPENGSFTGTYSHVVTGKIAPGTSGTFDIVVVPNDTEVCFNYQITLDKLEFIGPDGSVLDDANITIDSTNNIKLSDLRSHIRFTNEDGTDVTPTKTAAGAVTYGSYDLNSHNSTSSASFSVGQTSGNDTFTWNWPYQLESGSNEEKTAWDLVDTAAGKYSNSQASGSVNGLRMKVTYTVIATQVQPSTGAHNNSFSGGIVSGS